MLPAKYELREATVQDAYNLAPLLRQVDIDEIDAVTGGEPLEALLESIEHSHVCRVGLVDGEYACIYGVRRQSLLSDDGLIWMLGTDILSKHWVRFLKENTEEIKDITANTKFVENWCDIRNKITIRWLKWLGFEFDEAKPYGVKGLPFYHFWKRC